MKLTFWGAARQVTGSMFLLELADKYKILIDCGSDLSRNKQNTSLFSFNPSDIDLVLLTHAHYDHSGNIPHLILGGYKGQILCTPPTYSLAKLILKDSAQIHSSNLKRRLSKRRPKFIKEEVSNIYLNKQVDEAIDQFFTIAFNKRFEIREGLYVTFVPTGHLLGAANILLEVKENNEYKKIAFSGDIGRKNYPLLQDPHPLPPVDYLICESTYGSRCHTTKDDAEELLQKIIFEACVEVPGRLIIPSFSVGRTQALLYTLNKLYINKKLPPIKVFADSPMAEQSTKIYEEFVPLLNEEARAIYESRKSIFDFENLVQINTFKESKAISQHYEPCIIVSSSGMITGGRMEGHIKKNLNNPYCTILMVGYCAEGTPGHQLINQKSVRVKGRNIPVMAKVVVTDIFSGHADREDLINFVKVHPAEKLKRIFLVHGEYDCMKDFKKALEEEGYGQVEIPRKGETFDL